MPRLQLAQHQRIGQQVEITAHGGLAHPKRSRRIRITPDLAVIVRHHGPEAAHGSRGNPRTPLRQVAFDDGVNEVAPPTDRGLLIWREQGIGKAAAAPERLRSIRAGFIEREAAHAHMFHSTSKALGALAQQRT